MFIGHFALGFGARRAAPRAPFALLFVAPQWADLVWPLLVLLGVERASIAPGFTKMSPLDLAYMPYSHSLVALIAWGLLLGLAAWWMADARSGGVVGLLVVSHWVLDWITHAPDMPIYPGGPKYGLGLWNSAAGTLATEFVMFAIGVWLYFGSTRPRDRIGTYAPAALVAVAAVLYLVSSFGPPPPSITVMTATALPGAALFILWAWWGDRHRVVRA